VAEVVEEMVEVVVLDVFGEVVMVMWREEEWWRNRGCKADGRTVYSHVLQGGAVNTCDQEGGGRKSEYRRCLPCLLLGV
jgi:hypothetical protein